ncbi:hypothetical protein, partial [Endozoicomonas sp. ONNA2]|uniref:hypothetical protein n=1 Tax=Endozoicomonas sp. ONNA2 TaxID=2828741 RepID=UPI002148F7A5
DQFAVAAVGQSILGQPPGVAVADLSACCRGFCEAFLVLPAAFCGVSFSPCVPGPGPAGAVNVLNSRANCPAPTRLAR